MTLVATSEYIDLQRELLLQQSIDRLSEEIAARGFNIAVDDDFHGLRRYLRAVGAYDNPSFDPDEHDLSSNAFWLRVEDSRGKIVASHAERIYQCQDFVSEVIESDRVWFDRGVSTPRREWRTEVTHPPVKIGGNVGFAGGMFIQPDHRGAGLSVFLPYFSRSLCMRNYATDWHTGLVRQNIAASPVPTGYYGFPRTTHLFDGTIPRTAGGFKDLHLCWMTREEGFVRLQELPSHPRYPVALPILKPKGRVLS
jgi:hypothetical protein